MYQQVSPKFDCQVWVIQGMQTTIWASAELSNSPNIMEYLPYFPNHQTHHTLFPYYKGMKL